MVMKSFPLLLSLVCASALAAPMEIELWPGGPPGNEPPLEPERDMTKDTDNKVAGIRVIRLGNVSKPTLTVFPTPAEKRGGAAVLVCPGGGYNILAMDLEGTEVCERLNQMGITGFLLKYRVPKRPNQEKHQAPLQDAQRALGILRLRAAEWGIDPTRIGVLGFSAGGHLAAALSNNHEKRTYNRIDAADDLSCRPDFTVLIYPAYLTPDKDGTKLSPEIGVSTNTPQAFIAMTADDSVRVENALTYSAALRREKIPFQLHVYPTGGHGYGLRKTGWTVASWPERLEEWLIDRKLVRN
jgi:acetyl esterase/lipase